MVIIFCSAVKRPHDWTPSLRHAQRLRVSPESPLFIGCTDSWDVFLQVCVSVSVSVSDASTSLLQRLSGHMISHSVDFIGGDFNMSAFSTVGDVFSDPEFAAPGNSLLWGLGGLDETCCESTGFIIMPRHPHTWRVQSHCCCKFDNGDMGFGPRDLTTHFPLPPHLRVTNLPGPDAKRRRWASKSADDFANDLGNRLLPAQRRLRTCPPLRKSTRRNYWSAPTAGRHRTPTSPPAAHWISAHADGLYFGATQHTSANSSEI